MQIKTLGESSNFLVINLMNTNNFKVLLESLAKLDKPLDIIKHEIQQNAKQMVDIQDVVVLHKIDVVNVMKVFLDKLISSDDLS
ncbi:MAG: hypothetical protein ACD_26C00068G0005, partial [uncultured bacterium]